MIPSKLHPIDRPSNSPLLNSLKLLVSLLLKHIYDKFSTFPKIIKKGLFSYSS